MAEIGLRGPPSSFATSIARLAKTRFASVAMGAVLATVGCRCLRACVACLLPFAPARAPATCRFSNLTHRATCTVDTYWCNLNPVTGV